MQVSERKKSGRKTALLLIVFGKIEFLKSYSRSFCITESCFDFVKCFVFSIYFFSKKYYNVREDDSIEYIKKILSLFALLTENGVWKPVHKKENKK